MFCRFFIDRPIFAAVISLVITLAGGLAFFSLPVAQFPRITPPTVTVSCNYPGASARDVAEAVAAPIEKEVNGVEGMMYMSSSCTNDGAYNLTITFHQGTDPNVAQVLVQNRVALAINKLPDVIKATGVTTRKRSPDILMGVSLNSPGGRYNQLYLSNYAVTKVRDELARLEGVGDVFIFGQQDYALRVWLNPDLLSARNLTPMDVVRAIRDANREVAAGRVGSTAETDWSGERSADRRGNAELSFTLSTLGRLEDVEQFRNILVRVDEQGRSTRIKDIARVELGARTQDSSSRLDGKPTVFCAIFQRPDANALETAARVKAKMRELEADFPEDLIWEVGFETTPYTEESIREVSKTLQEAVVLVSLVVLLFLQNGRAAVIPLTAVPVAIIGTFGVMALMGFSLNNLTLFGLVLAIGIVVDDAIVVVEAVEHHIETGLSPRDATIRAMEQVAGPVIAVGLVLSAVFVPCAFIRGMTGLFFRQFALTIAVSTLISALNSLTLSPAMCALLLSPREERKGEPLPWLAYPLLGGILGYVFGGQAVAGWLPEGLERWSAIVVVVFGVVTGAVLAWPLKRVVKWLFAAFHWWMQSITQWYVRRVAGILTGGMALVSLGGMAVGVALGLLWLRPHLPTWVGWIAQQAAERGWSTATAILASAPPEMPTFLAGVVGAGLGWALAAGVAGAARRIFHLGDGRGWVPWRMAVSGRVVVLATYAGLLWLTGYGFARTPRGFIPPQDMGYLLVTVQLPDAAATERTDAVMRQMEQIVLRDPAVRHCTSIVGSSFALNATGPNFGSMFVNLKPYPQRRSPELSSDAVLVRLMREFSRITEAMIQVIPPPPVRGVGRAGGFSFVVEDRGDVGPNVLEGQVENLIRQASQQPSLQRLFTSFRANVPQLHVQPDPAECAAKGVSIDDANNTLRIYQGSLYVNDFNKFGRTWQVVVQADAPYRTQPEQINRLKVRSRSGAMVPLGSVVQVKEQNGPLVLTRYNMYPAAVIQGSAAPGVSSRQAIEIMQNLAKRELPAALAYEWTDMSYLELQAGNTAMVLFAMGAVAVFLVLAAQYESWSLPLAVILVIPMCVLSGLVGVWLWRQDVNIFTQIGFVVLVGLASKNAILIVEFARSLRHRGESRLDATLDACRLRLRPIVMTSVAFILGVVPMLVGRGAGAEMRKALGTAVFCGMIGVTLFGLFLTPVFFFVIDWLGDSKPIRTLGEQLGKLGERCRLPRWPRRGESRRASNRPIAPVETVVPVKGS